MPDDWSWLFDRDTEVQRPPYLSDVREMGLQSVEGLADPVVLRGARGGPPPSKEIEANLMG